ncbi:MAG: preprotein translocase subunit YajC [Nitrospirota bacterium]
MIGLSNLYLLAAQAQAPQPASPQPPGGGSVLSSFLPLIMIFGIFWFLLIRPQQKEKKTHQQMLADLKKGDKIITSSGIYGVIFDVKENTLILRIGDKDMKIEILKSAVASRIDEEKLQLKKS